MPKFLKETGEMSQRDIEMGGDWYVTANQLKNAAQHIQKLTKRMLKFIKVRPFDQYQGPYAQCKLLNSWARLWMIDTGNNIYYLENPMERDIDMEGDVYDIARQIRKYQKEMMTTLSQEQEESTDALEKIGSYIESIKKIKLTNEDISKYATEDELYLLEASENTKSKCSRCGKFVNEEDWKINGKLCNMCADDIDMGRDKE